LSRDPSPTNSGIDFLPNDSQKSLLYLILGLSVDYHRNLYFAPILGQGKLPHDAAVPLTPDGMTPVGVIAIAVALVSVALAFSFPRRHDHRPSTDCSLINCFMNTTEET